MITVENLKKEFFVPEILPGPFGTIRSLLSRKGRTVTAVDDISFQIAPGEFVGYIGPNGAGKSTTIKMLTGILHPTAGSVHVLGLSPQRERRQVVARSVWFLGNVANCGGTCPCKNPSSSWRPCIKYQRNATRRC